MSTPQKIQGGVPKGSFLSCTLYNLYVNDLSGTPGVHLTAFADDTCVYTTDHKECYVLRKL